MQQPMQPIIQHLFQAPSLEDVSRTRLEAFVEEFPAFGIGHYLLSRKLKAEGSERFAQETQRTGLYFTNPFWLQWQLEHLPAAGSRPEELTPAEPGLAEADTTEAVETGMVAPEAIEAETVAAEAVEAETAVTEAAFALPVGDDLAEALSNGKEDMLTTEEKESMTAGEGEAIAGAPVQTIDTEEGRKVPSAAELLLRSIEEAKGLRESLYKINNDLAAETAVAGEAIPLEAGEPVTAEQEPPRPMAGPIKDEEAPFVLDEPAAPEPPPAPEPATAAPIFEPYHTIDYFASQGIKLTLDENPSDALGKQVKSFTEWLKSMKRLPQKDREVIPDRVSEQAVQTIAAHSIEGKDVLTETMAEVLAKQGMREKARVVYEKLSLLNPDKRAYFASKIEQLNIS